MPFDETVPHSFQIEIDIEPTDKVRDSVTNAI